MVHIIANLGVFFAFLITSGAWVMLKVGAAIAGAAAFVVSVWLGLQRARRRRRPGRRP